MKTTNEVELVSGAVRRSLYFFNCSGCGKGRETVFKRYADRKICRGCRTKVVNKDQMSLIESAAVQI